LVGEAYDLAKRILSEYRDKLDLIATRLMEVETINRDEFEELFPPPVEKNGGTPVPLPA
jgi:cell division protease FtsH